MKFIDSQEAFEKAIKQGRLSAEKTSPTFAGNYMYMGTAEKIIPGTSGLVLIDLFKHNDTREYLPAL